MNIEFPKNTPRLDFDEWGDLVLSQYRDLNELLAHHYGLDALYMGETKYYLDTSTIDKWLDVCDVSHRLVSYEEEISTSHTLYQVKGFNAFLQTSQGHYGKEKEMALQGKVKVFKVHYTRDTDLLSLEKVLKENLTKVESGSSVNILIKEGPSLVFKDFPLKVHDIDIQKMYNDDFEKVNELCLDKLEEGSKGLYLFHGTTGSGKTSYIKWLTKQLPSKNFVFVPSNMIQLLNDPSLMPLLIEKPELVLILEDCETYIKDRKKGEHSLVDTILNITDGILSDVLNMQVIATFNNDFSSIDGALKRKGRLICSYEFKALERLKTINLLKELGYDVEDSQIQEGLTLANIFNYSDFQPVSDEEKPKIGFGKR